MVPQKQVNFEDPFIAGQMVGMMVMLTFFENNEDVPKQMLEDLKRVAADNAQKYFKKPTEDIYLMIDDLVEEIKI